MPTYDESATGLMVPRSRNGHLSESLAGYAAMVELLESRLGDLELQLADQGWSRLDNSGAREFSRDALGRIVDLARVNYLKNPIINRAVEIAALYVWGQDLSVNAEDDDVRLVIDRFWRDNASTLTGQAASRLLEVELQTTGNVFLALFPDRITGAVRVRNVPMEEVQQIITNPEDRADVWFYRRTWSEQSIDGVTSDQRSALYPDWRYSATDRPESIGGVEVRWESPFCHIKAGAFAHWRWGVPEVYAALDWAKAYKEQLEDDATRSRALARFAWNLTTKGGKNAVTQARTKLNTTYAAGGSGTETNPPPVPGSTFIAGEGVDLQPMRIAGATLDPDHSRPARQMASAALGIPDHFFDANQSNLATSKTLDRPTELRFSERRQMWRDVLTELCQWVIDADLAATRGILPKTITDKDRVVELSWPSLLERDTREVVGGIVDAATLAGRSLAGTIPRATVARQLMVAIGIDNVDDEIAAMEDEWAEQDAERNRVQQQMQPKPEKPEQDDGETTGNEPRVPAREAASITDVDGDGELTLSDVLGIIDWWKGNVPAKYSGLLDAAVITGDNHG